MRQKKERGYPARHLRRCKQGHIITSMCLVLFWIKIAAKRTLEFFRSYPVIVAGTIIIIVAFIFARDYISVTVSTQTLFIGVLTLIAVSLLSAFKNHNLTPILIVHSKSKFQNKKIYALFFLKESFKNHLFLYAFCIICIKRLITLKYFFVIPLLILLSPILSFVIMYIKSNWPAKRKIAPSAKNIKTHPILKSALYDYFNADFFISALLSVVLFSALAIVFTIGAGSRHTLENEPIFFTGTLIAFSFGFGGILSSIQNINWNFFSIIYPRDYIYHIKRTILFMCPFFGLPIVIFIFVGSPLNLPRMFKYLYCIIVLLLSSINIAFSISVPLRKMIKLSALIVFSAWISTLHSWALPVLFIPLFLTFITAKYEYTERYLL